MLFKKEIKNKDSPQIHKKHYYEYEDFNIELR